MGLNQRSVRFAPAFDENAHSPPPPSITLSSGHFVESYKITQGFRLEPMPLMLTIFYNYREV